MTDDTIVLHSSKDEDMQPNDDGQKAKRRKRQPRPGETSFRVPLNLNTPIRAPIPVHPSIANGYNGFPQLHPPPQLPQVQQMSTVNSSPPYQPPPSNVVLPEAPDWSNSERASSGPPVPNKQLIQKQPLVQTPASIQADLGPVRGGTKMDYRAYVAPNESPTVRRKTEPREKSRGQSRALQTPQTRLTPPRTRRSEAKDAGLINNSRTQGIDFEKAPLENLAELTWWTAQVISHMESSRVSSPETEDRVRTLSPNQFYGSRSSKNALEPSTQDRVREDARERKQRWRADNRERNRDNDLKCRIRKKAKEKFGDDETPEKSAWFEKEFKYRRELRQKREQKQREAAAKSGEFPKFPDHLAVRETFAEGNEKPTFSTKVQQVRKVLIDLFFPKDSEKPEVSQTKIAKQWRSVIKDTNYDDQTIKAAFESIAQNDAAFQSVKAALGVSTLEDDDDEVLHFSDAGKVANASSSKTAGKRSTNSSPNHSLTENDTSKVEDMIKAMHEALAILTDMNDFKPYASPYANLDSSTPAASLPNGSANSSHSAGKRATLEEVGFTEAQLDRFLTAANGGRPWQNDDENDYDDSDDSDDDCIEVTGEEKMSEESTTTMVVGDELDSDILKTINMVIDRLVEKRIATEVAAQPVGSKNPVNGYNAQVQADKARKLLSDAGLRSNVFLTRDMSQAVSQFYNQLRQHLDPDAQGFKLPEPSSFPHAEITEQTQPSTPTSALSNRLKRKFSEIGLEISTPSVSLTQPSPSPSSGTPVTGVRTEEEQKRIKSYGFPPPPGSRIGRH